MPIGSSELPEWLLWAAGFVGTTVAVVLARLGFGKGASGHSTPEKPASVAAVVVDMESLHRLTASIEGHSFTLLEGKKALIVFSETAEKATEQLAEELRNLQREVRELAREVGRKH